MEHFKQYHVSQTSQDTAAESAVILVLQPAQSVDDLSTELCFTLLGGILVDDSGYCLYVYSDSHMTSRKKRNVNKRFRAVKYLHTKSDRDKEVRFCIK